jgi:hypothetical protein
VTVSDFLSRLRKQEPLPDGLRPSAANTYPTKALPRFLAALSAKEQPVLLDLGTVVGENVNFFGEHLGCKISVEDLAKDIDRHVREDTLRELPAFLEKRFPQAAESFDGIICWDVFDFLDRPAGQVLAKQMIRMLKPDGMVLAFFNHSEHPVTSSTYTRHLVVDQRTLEHKPYPAARGKQRPLPNRDIQRMFEPLRITEQFLLKTNMREVVLRKVPAAAVNVQS